MRSASRYVDGRRRVELRFDSADGCENRIAIANDNLRLDDELVVVATRVEK